MPAAVEVAVHHAVLAHHERGRRLAEVLDLEAHAAALLGQRAGVADQAWVFSHSSNALTLSMQPSGSQARKPSSACAPYVTASASTPAARAISRSCDVSPIMRVCSLHAFNSSISSSSIAGWGLGLVSSAQREAMKVPFRSPAWSARSSPRRLLPVAIASR